MPKRPKKPEILYLQKPPYCRTGYLDWGTNILEGAIKEFWDLNLNVFFLFITTAMEITVLGTESPPTFSDAPAGPYKMQKEVILTQIYDELWQLP